MWPYTSPAPTELSHQQQLKIAKNYAVFNCGGPTKCGSPSTRTCRGKILINDRHHNTVNLGMFSNIFDRVDRGYNTYNTCNTYSLDCSKLPEGYFCFCTTDADPYNHVFVMHRGIPIFYFMKPTNTTDPTYEVVGYEGLFQRDGGLDMTRMRNELHQRMGARPPSSRRKSTTMTYQQAKKIHLDLRRQLDQCKERGIRYPRQLLKRYRDIDGFIARNQPKRR